MRARNVKPALFKNEFLATADPLNTVIFEGLWCVADRAGRLEDRPRRIHLEINPGRAYEGTETALAWLAEHGFIVRYTHGTGQYIQIVNFSKHQNPHMREPASTIPPPGASTEQASDIATHKDAPKSDSSTVLAPGSNDAGPASCLLPDSGSLIKDMAAKRPSVRSRFAEFWAAYPKKVKKKNAERLWHSKKLDAIADTLLDDIKRRSSEDRRWVGGYICDPPVYLGGERWNDAIEPIKKNGNGQHAADAAAKERSQILDLASMFGMELEGDEEWTTFKARVERANERRLASLGR